MQDKNEKEEIENTEPGTEDDDTEEEEIDEIGDVEKWKADKLKAGS